MSDSDANRSGSPEPAAPAPSNSERRRNHALRELVDEMLASIRAAARQDLWTTEERAQYERELSTIMSRVRTEAIGGEDAGAPKAAGKG